MKKDRKGPLIAHENTELDTQRRIGAKELEKYLGHLPPKQEFIVRHHAMFGQTLTELDAELDLPKGRSKQLYHIAKRAMYGSGKIRLIKDLLEDE